MIFRAKQWFVFHNLLQDRIGSAGYQETCRWAGVYKGRYNRNRKGCYSRNRSTSFHYTINSLVRIKYRAQEHEHANESTLELRYLVFSVRRVYDHTIYFKAYLFIRLRSLFFFFFIYVGSINESNLRRKEKLPIIL